MNQWSVVRTYRRTARVVKEGTEDECRVAYKRAAEKLRDGSVLLKDVTGIIRARSDGGYNRSRW